MANEVGSSAVHPNTLPVLDLRGRRAGADHRRQPVLARDDRHVAHRPADVAHRSADLVVSFQVFEHVRDIDTYLQEAGRVLRDDGVMLLSTHGTWLYHPHPEDHRRWTREGLIGELERRGFEVTDCIAVVGPLAWTTMVRLTCFAVALRRLPLIGKSLAAAIAVVMNLKAGVEDWVTPAWVTKDNACVYVTLSRRSPVRP